jgi:hypothetical protein
VLSGVGRAGGVGLEMAAAWDFRVAAARDARGGARISGVGRVGGCVAAGGERWAAAAEGLAFCRDFQSGAEVDCAIGEAGGLEVVALRELPVVDRRGLWWVAGNCRSSFWSLRSGALTRVCRVVVWGGRRCGSGGVGGSGAYGKRVFDRFKCSRDGLNGLAPRGRLGLVAVRKVEAKYA